MNDIPHASSRRLWSLLLGTIVLVLGLSFALYQHARPYVEAWWRDRPILAGGLISKAEGGTVEVLLIPADELAEKCGPPLLKVYIREGYGWRMSKLNAGFASFAPQPIRVGAQSILASQSDLAIFGSRNGSGEACLKRTTHSYMVEQGRLKLIRELHSLPRCNHKH